MILLTQYNLPYLPIPNRIEIIADQQTSPEHLTMTGFLLPFTLDRGIVLANNCRRGLEIPGGHKEEGEDSAQAAIRECWEETGCRVSRIQPVGYLKMISSGPTPEGWRYPHPLSYQQFYTGLVDWQDEYTPNDECSYPLKVMADGVATSLRPARQALYIEARRLLFGE